MPIAKCRIGSNRRMMIIPFLGEISTASPSASSNGIGWSDWIALASCVLSVIALWVSIHFARRAERAGKSANDIAIGQSETNLRTAITAAQERLSQSNIQIATIRKGKTPEELTSDERSIYEIYLAYYDRTAEQLLKSYEDACAKYLDNKIDRLRFKKAYEKELQDLCEKERGTIHKLLHPRDSSSYKAIWSVYEEWRGGQNSSSG